MAAMKSRNLFLTAFFLLELVVFSYSQTESFRFAQSGSDAYIKQMEVDSLGNNYIIGTFSSKFEYRGNIITGEIQSEGDGFILKTGREGELTYLKHIGASGNGGYIEIIKSVVNEKGELALIVNTNDATELILGDRNINIESFKGNTFVLKFSKNGFLVWVNNIYVEGTFPELEGRDIVMDELGQVYVSGDFEGTRIVLSSISIDGIDDSRKTFVVKYSVKGEPVWASTCGHIVDTTTGNIYAYDLEVNKDGLVYLAGIYDGYKQFLFSKDRLQNKGKSNAYLACIDERGNNLWALPFEGDNDIQPEQIALDNSGNAIFTCFYKSGEMNFNGNKYSSPNDYDLLTVNVTAEKRINWENKLETNLGSVDVEDLETETGVTEGTGVLVAGNIKSTTNGTFVQEIGADGVAKILFKTETSDEPNYSKARFDKDGNLVFTGNVYNSLIDIEGTVIEDKTGYGTSYFCKVQSTGDVNFLYQQQNKTDGTVDLNHIGFDAAGNLYVAGTYSGTNASLDTSLLGDKYTSGLFLSKYGRVGSVSGTIKDLSNVAIKGVVQLFGYSYLQRSFISDSTEINSDGTYNFDKVSLGKYLLKVLPENQDYFETYYPSLGGWERAAHVIIMPQTLNQTNVDVTVLKKISLTGSAGIGGKVTEIDGDDIFKGTMAKPKAKSRASLAKSKIKSDYEIIAETETDEEGNFAFTGIPNGSYVVLIDIPGLPNVEPHEVVVTDGQFVSNVDYFIDEETVKGVGKLITNFEHYEKEGRGKVNVLPNPSKGDVNIEVRDGETIEVLEILDLQGKIIRQFYNISGWQKVQGLNSGFYLVRYYTGGEKNILKLLVE